MQQMCCPQFGWGRLQLALLLLMAMQTVGFGHMITAPPIGNPGSHTKIGVTRHIGNKWVLVQQASEDVLDSGASNCSTPCSANGNCVNGTCICSPGFFNTSCLSVYLCNGIAANQSGVCSGHGSCVETDTCKCQALWGETDCAVFTGCSHNCSGNGHCLQNDGSCYCNFGWAGPFCDLKLDAPHHDKEWKKVFPPLGGTFSFDGTEVVVEGVLPSHLGQKPLARRGHTIQGTPQNPAGIIEGFVLFGGQSSTEVFDDTWGYKAESRAWRRLAQFSVAPSPRAHHTMTVIGSSLYVFGGFDGLDESMSSVLADTWRYSITDDEWALITFSSSEILDSGKPTIPPIGRALHAASAVKVQMGVGARNLRDVVLVFGGYVGAGMVDSSLWALDVQSLKQFQLTSPPFGARYGHTATTMPDLTTVLVFGGLDASFEYSSSLWAFSCTPTQTWTDLSRNGPRARAYHTATAFDGKLFVFGGESSESSFQNDMWQWHPERGWLSVQWASDNAHAPLATTHAASTLIGAGEVTIMGGINPATNAHTATLWLYEPTRHTWAKPISHGTTPTPRLLHSTVIIDDKLIVFGGETDSGNSLRDLWEFDMTTTHAVERHVMWREVVPGWVLQQKLVDETALGGLLSNSGCACKPSSENLESQQVHTGCAVNGYDGLPWCDTDGPCRFGEYWDYCDPAQRHASSRPPATTDSSRMFLDLAAWPLPRSGHAAVEVSNGGGVSAGGMCTRYKHNAMLMFGGTSVSAPVVDLSTVDTSSSWVYLNDLFVFCPESGQWGEVVLEKAPTPRTMTAITVRNRDSSPRDDTTEVFVFGGLGVGKIRLNDLWRCSLKSGSCSEISSVGYMPQRRRSMMFSLEHTRTCKTDCSYQSPENLLMFGGYWRTNEANSSGRYESSVQGRCNAVKAPFTSHYCNTECLANPTSSRCAEACRCKKEYAMDVWSLSTSSWTWEQIHAPDSPKPRFVSQATAYEGKLWVFGGLDLPQDELNDLWTFDTSRRAWRQISVDPLTMQPPGRHEAYLGITGTDQARPHLVLYSGVGASGVLGDLWMLDVGNAIGW
eukprot:c17_g1_i1.p1 GENE.c17_g1_i1~~c17_g1_i1.p1  ORF type:complete len:1060 (+),score=278.36 c17_g1_i1:34-3213(+)